MIQFEDYKDIEYILCLPQKVVYKTRYFPSIGVIRFERVQSSILSSFVGVPLYAYEDSRRVNCFNETVFCEEEKIQILRRRNYDVST